MKEKERLLSFKETRCLIKKAQSGDMSARNTLVERNRGLVCQIANRYTRYSFFGRSNPIDVSDLIQEGTFGLIRAIEKFNLKEKKVKFSTYSCHWIRSYVVNVILNNVGPMRMFHPLRSATKKKENLLASIFGSFSLDSPDSENCKDGEFILPQILAENLLKEKDFSVIEDDFLLMEIIEKVLLEELSREKRIIVACYFFEEHEGRLIKKIQGLIGEKSKSAIYQKLKQALRKLKRALIRLGLTEDELLA